MILFLYYYEYIIRNILDCNVTWKVAYIVLYYVRATIHLEEKVGAKAGKRIKEPVSTSLYISTTNIYKELVVTQTRLVNNAVGSPFVCCWD
jgi:hypothetical protein